MTGFDFAVIAILLVSLLFGLWRGLLYEVLSLLGWPLAFMLSNMYADGFAQYLPIPVLSNVEGKQEMLRTTGAYALVFIAVMIVWGVLVWALCKLLRAIGRGRRRVLPCWRRHGCRRTSRSASITGRAIDFRAVNFLG